MYRSMPVIVAPAVTFLVLACVLGTVADREPIDAAILPASSFAILARDALTGEYGVAAASHAPLIGMNLEFLDHEAGAVVVLGGPYIDLNERTLTALRSGLAPARAAAVGLAGAEDRETRQLMVLAPTGSAAFTGKNLPQYAGHRSGGTFLVAGNRLTGEEVLEAMQRRFEETDGPLADRLMASLEAGEEAGGERDGTHSAALLVVGSGNPFATRDRLIDLRIDFVDEDAVAALARLRAQVDSVYGVVK